MRTMPAHGKTTFVDFPMWMYGVKCYYSRVYERYQSCWSRTICLSCLNSQTSGGLK